MALKWGIAAAGRISHDFVNAVHTLSAEDHQIVAVGARDVSRAEEFAKRFDIPKAYGSYLELATDPNVEAVYVGTVSPQHFEVAKIMLEHGKHVLVEKPLCMNEKQSQKLVSLAKEKGLFLMEAIWSRYFPSYQYIRKQIQDGVLGDISSVEADFGFVGIIDPARLTNELGNGIIFVLGVYAIQFCQWVFQQEPTTIKATGTLNDKGVEVEIIVEFTYGENKVGKIKSSFINALNNTAKITGTKGQITIPAFCSPTTITDVDGTEKAWPLPEAKYHFNFENSCGLRYEADEVRKCIRGGKTESENATHDESLLIARIEDEIRKQIGVKYAEDD